MLTASLMVSAITALTPIHQCDPELDGSFCDCIPETFEDAVRCIGQVLNEEDEATLLGYRYEDLSMLHHGFGTGIRNAWLRSDRSPAQADMTARGFLHPDDMSTTIIASFWAQRHGCEFDLDETIAFYTTYWRARAVLALQRHPERAEHITVPVMDRAPVTERPVPDCPFPLDEAPPLPGLPREHN